MRYLIKNARITEGTTKTGAFAGQKYFLFQADLFVEGNIFANPARLPRLYTLNPQVSEAFMSAAIKNTADSTQDLTIYDVDLTKVDESLHHIANVFPFTKILARPYGRIDRQTKNFIIASNGSVTPVTAITIYGVKVQDNEMTGEMQWVEDMDQVVNRILERSYKPLDDSPIAPAPTATVQTPEEAKQVQEKIAELQAKLGVQ